MRIHQVLATLGYGDAIGHEVLGIQRVLRGAGYESEIFVETADERLERLTRDYRELVDFSHRDNLLLHHFSLGSKASRTAFALPDRMALIYHNITPPEYFVGLHRRLARQCFAAGVSCAPTQTDAISRWATRSSIASTSRAWGSPAPPSCRWCRTSPTSIASRDGCWRRSSTTNGRTSCSWAA
jgi:hypothetical protein